EAAVVRDGEHQLRRHHDVSAPCLSLQRDRERARRDVVSDLDAEFRHQPEVSASIAPVPASIDFLKRVSMFEDLDQKSLEAIALALLPMLTRRVRNAEHMLPESARH